MAHESLALQVWRFWWDELSPHALFIVRPEDCAGNGSLCKGTFWSLGLSALFGLHVACFAAAMAEAAHIGWRDEVLVALAPVAVVWLLLAGADLQFRLRKPTPEQRAGFDDAVLGWVGFWALLLTAGVGIFTALGLVIQAGRWAAGFLPSGL